MGRGSVLGIKWWPLPPSLLLVVVGGRSRGVEWVGGVGVRSRRHGCPGGRGGGGGGVRGAPYPDIGFPDPHPLSRGGGSGVVVAVVRQPPVVMVATAHCGWRRLAVEGCHACAKGQTMTSQGVFALIPTIMSGPRQ